MKERAHLLQGAFYVLLLLAGTLLAFWRPEASPKVPGRTLTFQERVAYQRAIEEVYWRHRIWPKERLAPKPSLDAVMSQAQLERKVEDYLRKSQSLEYYWQQSITADQLQAEMDRMAQRTRQPWVLRELFGALGNDPFVIAECLARPLLAKRLLTHSATEQVKKASGTYEPVAAAVGAYRLPSISDDCECTDDTWTSISITNAPDGRQAHTAVWTGSEMIVWGGYNDSNYLNTGGSYNPSTDNWTATSGTNAPSARAVHTAVWSGNEMIVWGGYDGSYSNTGGRYNPSTNSWTTTSIGPTGRVGHTAVWSGSEVIVWGGYTGNGFYTNTGGSYNPTTDSWTVTSITNAPSGRAGHTAVSTGSAMIVWGGDGPNSTVFNTGGTYHPDTDSWTATTTTFAPVPRDFHTAVWTGSEMIIWGGLDPIHLLSTGGRYNPTNDNWTATSTTNAPQARYDHTAVWTGSEMIVWGGNGITGTPTARPQLADQPASDLNTGGIYCAQSAATPTPTPTLTPRPSPTPRVAPTPRVRPTPPPRP